MIPANIQIDGSTLSRYALPPISQFPAKASNGCAMSLERFERGKYARLAYEQTIRELLREIGMTGIGSAILTAIAISGKRLLIKPYLDWTVPNALTSAQKPLDSRPKGAPIYFGFPDDPKTKADESLLGVQNMGTGLGSDTDITFNPELTGFPEFPNSKPPGFPMEPSAILIHELVHALRDLTGTTSLYPLHDPAAIYQNTEEFAAILIANMYASERGALVLRKDYTPKVFVPMEPQYMEKGRFFDTSTAYGRANSNALKLARLDPSLLWRFAFVSTARFNPFHDALDSIFAAGNRLLRALGF